MKEQIEKQAIEEIAKVLEGVCDKVACSDYHMNCDLCQATCLYDAGYRKQSDGFWGYDEGCDCFVCSLCQHSALNNYRGLSVNSKFCPNCGAKMKGANNEN